MCTHLILLQTGMPGSYQFNTGSTRRVQNGTYASPRVCVHHMFVKDQRMLHRVFELSSPNKLSQSRGAHLGTTYTSCSHPHGQTCGLLKVQQTLSLYHLTSHYSLHHTLAGVV